MGKVKRLELWWQLYLYVTSGWGLRTKPPITSCAFECTGGWVCPLDRSGEAWKISPPTVFDPRTVQPVFSRYNDWAIRTHFGTLLLITEKAYKVWSSLLRIFLHVPVILSALVTRFPIRIFNFKLIHLPLMMYVFNTYNKDTNVVG
jgi:hypothetical protein